MSRCLPKPFEVMDGAFQRWLNLECVILGSRIHDVMPGVRLGAGSKVWVLPSLKVGRLDRKEGP